MLRHKEFKNAYEKQEKTQNKKIWRSNKKTGQEQLKDHEEHFECMNFRKMQDAHAIDTKLITWHMTQTRNRKIFLIFMIF